MNRLKIGHQIFLTFVLTIILVIGMLVIGHRYAFQNGFLRYTASLASEQLGPLQETLLEVYQEQGNWDFIRGEETWRPEHLELIYPVRRRAANNRQGGRGDRRQRPRTRDVEREATRTQYRPAGRRAGGFRPRYESLSLQDAQGQWVAGAPITQKPVRIPIELDQQVVGYFALEAPRRIRNDLDLAFYNEQMRFTLIMGLLALGLATLTAFVLSRRFSKPLEHLAGHVNRLTRGDYKVLVNMYRRDEIGALARDVNLLAETLELTRERQRDWVADTSHELRTPITILLAELEAIHDGLRPLDAAALSSFEIEFKRLKALVDDLQQLAASDRGSLNLSHAPFDLNQVIEESLNTNRARIENHSIVPERVWGATLQQARSVSIVGDASRMRQVFDNLFENSLRYTKAPGRLQVTLDQQSDAVTVRIEDSAPGVPKPQIPRLFDRFFRIEKSRNRATGASGLGLSICRSIIDAHGGTISASSSKLGGLAIEIRLPCEGARSLL